MIQSLIARSISENRSNVQSNQVYSKNQQKLRPFPAKNDHKFLDTLKEIIYVFIIFGRIWYI